MRIAVLLPRLEPCGGVRRLLDFAAGFARRGHETVVYVPPPGEPLRPWCAVAVPVRPAVEAALADPVDVLLYPDGAVSLALRFRRVGLRVHLHVAVRRPLEGVPPADLRVAFSTWAARRVEGELGERVVAVLPGVDRRVFRPLDVPREYDLLCWGTRKRYGKGTADIETAARLAGRRLVRLAGRGLTDEAWCGELNRARVFVSASWQESCNQCALEALACGVPLLTTDDGGSGDFARPEETALVVPPRDPSALAAGMVRLLTDGALRERLRAAGLRLVDARFDLEAATDRFLAVLAGARRRPGHRPVAAAPEERPRFRPRRFSAEGFFARWTALRRTPEVSS